MAQKKPPKPRKHPQQSRSQKKVEQILKTAAHILETAGLEGFNTNAIAESADISIGSLYQYFPDKDAIAATLIRDRTEAFLQALEAAIRPEVSSGWSVEEKIEALIKIAVEQQLSSPQLARSLDIEEARLPINGETQVAQGRILAVISQLLNEAGYREIKTITQDVLAISRGMIDTAGSMGENDSDGLEQRVSQAIFGYLEKAEKRL